VLLVDIIYIKSTTKTSFQALAATTKSSKEKRKKSLEETQASGGKKEKKRKLKIVHASENKE